MILCWLLCFLIVSINQEYLLPLADQAVLDTLIGLTQEKHISGILTKPAGYVQGER